MGDSSKGSKQSVNSKANSATHMDAIWALVQGSVVLLDKVPPNFIFRNIESLCLLFWLSGGGGCGSLVVVWRGNTGGVDGERLGVGLLEVTSVCCRCGGHGCRWDRNWGLKMADEGGDGWLLKGWLLLWVVVDGGCCRDGGGMVQEEEWGLWTRTPRRRKRCEQKKC